MRIDETVLVVKGPHAGKKAKIRGTSGFFYHIHLLTPSGRRVTDGILTVHRSAIDSLPTGVESH